MNYTNIKYSFSSYVLKILNECKRCFWLHCNAKIERPRCISSLPLTGMHSKIKKHLDMYRGSIPNELKDKINGVFMDDVSKLRKWRTWNEGLFYFDENLEVRVNSAIEDCIIKNEKYSPLDYTLIWGPLTESENEKYFKVQMDINAYLLEVNDYPISGDAYVIYYYPKNVEDNGIVKCDIDIVKMHISLDTARALINEAVYILNGPIPEFSETCECCSYVNALNTTSIGNTKNHSTNLFLN